MMLGVRVLDSLDLSFSTLTFEARQKPWEWV
jgi:hypothetical protein